VPSGRSANADQHVQSYEGRRGRLNMMSAATVPTKAGTGRMNTMRTAHIN
jgi:hypothetical protein